MATGLNYGPSSRPALTHLGLVWVRQLTLGANLTFDKADLALKTCTLV